MNLFEKIAKKQKTKKNNVLIGIASGLGGMYGGALMVNTPMVIGKKTVLNKEVLKDITNQEIMDYYNKTYGKSMTDVDEYTKTNPKAKKVFRNIYEKAIVRNGKLPNNEIEKYLTENNIPINKQWIISKTYPLDGALTVNKNFGIHFSDYSAKNKAVAAHELGHLSDNWLEHPYGHTIYGASNGAVGLGMLYSTIQGARGKELSNKEIAATSLASLPVLAAETKANLRAAKAIYALRGKKGLREALPTLAISQLSYSTLPFVPYVSNKLSKKIKNKLTEMEDKQ